MALRIWAFALWTMTASMAFAAEPSLIESRDGVLVLRNGFVLHGRITPQGDSYLVSFDGKGEARLPRTEVEFECRNLDEAYLIKRDTLASDDVKAHVTLADWCLRHSLMARAADQLLVIQNQDPSHPMLLAMERRLESFGAASRRSELPPTTSAQKPASATTESPAVPPSPVQEIAPMLMQQFTMTIQPILLNRCGTLSCHGAMGTTNYRLLRPAMGHAPASRLTHRNLQATLAYVDRRNPVESRLLAMAKQPHGGVATVVFHEKTGNQFDVLAGWVRRLDGSVPVTPSDRQTAGVAKPATLPASPSVKVAATPHLSGTPGKSEQLDADAHSTRSAPSETGSPPAGAKNVKDFTPRDPFDPEVFNRQFHKPG